MSVSTLQCTLCHHPKSKDVPFTHTSSSFGPVQLHHHRSLAYLNSLNSRTYYNLLNPLVVRFKLTSSSTWWSSCRVGSILGRTKAGASHGHPVIHHLVQQLTVLALSTAPRMLQRAVFSESANSSQAAFAPHGTFSTPLSKSFVPDATVKVDQGLLKSVGSAAFRHGSLAPVPAAAAFSTTDVLIRSPDAREQAATPLLSQQHRTVPFNDTTQAVDFETPLFKGKVLLLMRGMANTPAGVFDGKKRLMWMAVQGQFKQPGVSFDSLCLGSEFARPLKLPAGALLSRASMWLVSKMGSGVQLDTAGTSPHILAPLIAAAQVVNVSKPGQEPDMFDAEEDMTAFDASLVGSWSGKALSGSKRRALFGGKAARQARCFDTEHVWTFQVYDHLCDYATFLLPIPFFKVDLVQVLDGQPMQLLLKDTSSGLSMLKLEVWHRRMLEHKANSSSSSSSASSSASCSSSCYDMQGLIDAAALGCDDSPRCSAGGGRLSRAGSLRMPLPAAGMVKA